LARVSRAILAGALLALGGCSRAAAPPASTLFLAGHGQIRALRPSDLSVAARLALPAPAIAGVADAARLRLDLVLGGSRPVLAAVPAAAPRLYTLSPLDLAPRAVVLGHRGRRLYVLGRAGNRARLEALDAATGAALKRLPLPGSPSALALSPSGRILAATTGPNAVILVAADLAAPLHAVALACPPRQLVSLPYNHKAFVLCPHRLAVVDTSAPGVLTYLELGAQPRRMLLKPDGGELYVTNAEGNVSIVDTANNEVSGTLLAGAGAGAMAVSPHGSTLYVANAAAGTVSVINLDARTQLAMVRVGERPERLALAGDFVFAADAGSGDLAAIRSANDPNNPDILLTLLPSPRQPSLLIPVPRR
jgi:YVTN family beta-propeller protein